MLTGKALCVGTIPNTPTMTQSEVTSVAQLVLYFLEDKLCKWDTSRNNCPARRLSRKCAHKDVLVLFRGEVDSEFEGAYPGYTLSTPKLSLPADTLPF